MTRKKTRWTREENEKLKRLHSEGRSFCLIAESLGTKTENSCRCHLNYLRTKKERLRKAKRDYRAKNAGTKTGWTYANDYQLIELVRLGATLKQIAEFFGRKQPCVRARYRRLKNERIVPEIAEVRRCLKRRETDFAESQHRGNRA